MEMPLVDLSDSTPLITSGQIDMAIRPACLRLDMVSNVAITHDAMRSVLIAALEAMGLQIQADSTGRENGR